MSYSYPLTTMQLLEYAEGLTFKTQARLVHVENEFARNFYVNVLPDPGWCPPRRWEIIQNYLLLTSLPFSYKQEHVSLEELWPKACIDCTLTSSRVMQERLFFPTGCLEPLVMVVGDAPAQVGGYGAKDMFDPDKDIGRIWVSKPTSIILRKALTILDLHWRAWYTNLSLRSIKENAPTNGQERMKCGKHISKQLELLKPQFVLALGNHVAEHWNWPVQKVKVPHPSYVVRMNWSAEDYAKIIRRSIQIAGFAKFLGA